MDLIHHPSQVVRQHQLLEQADEEELEPQSDFFGPPGRVFAQLGQEVDRSHNRAGDQLREEGNEEGEIHEVTCRAGFSPVDVDRVAHALEGVEGDSHRQQKLMDGQMEAQIFGQAVAEEVVVLEDRQDAEIGAQAEDQEEFSPSLGLGFFDPPCGEVVDQGGSGDQQGVTRVPAAVKKIAGDQQDPPSGRDRRQAVQNHHRAEENQEGVGMEKHGI